MRLVFGMASNDSPHLLPAHFERPVERFIVEEPLADLFFYSVVAEAIEHIAGQIQMFAPPMRHQLLLAVEVCPTQIAADFLTQA